MKTFVPFFVLLLFYQSVFAQEAEQADPGLAWQFEDYNLPLRPSERVEIVKAMQLPFGDISAMFHKKVSGSGKQAVIGKAVRKGVLLDFNMGMAKGLFDNHSTALRLSLPTPSGKEMELELVKVDILSPAFFLNSSTHPAPIRYNPGAHYHGVVKGVPGSIATLSVFEDEVMAMFSTPEAGNFVLGALDAPTGTQKQDTYILYEDRDLIGKPDWVCSTDDDLDDYFSEPHDHSSTQKTMANECINVYVEIDDDIVSNKGGATNASNYIIGVFNQAVALFAAEDLQYYISHIYTWTSSSPYSSLGTDNSSTWLTTFKNQTSDINGDLGHLVSYRISGGKAAGFSGLCNSNVDNSLCVSGISTSYNFVPTYSWSAMVVTHEMGHLNGSRHTHACVWNGNNTAIDGCAGSTEGSCSLPGNPSSGGTVMSYCHQQSVGINFSLGFGDQPGDQIRATAAAATCLDCNLIGRKVALQALINGKYVSADNNGNDKLVYNISSIGSEEEFDVVDGGNGYIGLRARVNNKYVCAENGGSSALIANRGNIANWERFTWVRNSTGSMSLRAKANNKFVKARDNNNKTLKAESTGGGTRAQFNVIYLGYSKRSIAAVTPSVNGQKQFKVYPNPAHDYLNLSAVETGEDVEVYNLQGQQVMHAHATEQLDVSGLAPGTYLLRINGYQTQRFVKL